MLCANGKVAAGSLAASINLYFSCGNAALEPMECGASNLAGFVCSVDVRFCGCAVNCSVPEEVGRGLCQAHLNTEGILLRGIYARL